MAKVQKPGFFLSCCLLAQPESCGPIGLLFDKISRVRIS
jgi:hypothetical protein